MGLHNVQAGLNLSSNEFKAKAQTIILIKLQTIILELVGTQVQTVLLLVYCYWYYLALLLLCIVQWCGVVWCDCHKIGK